MTAEEVVDLAFEMSKGRIKSEKERKEYMKKAFTVQMISEYQLGIIWNVFRSYMKLQVSRIAGSW